MFSHKPQCVLVHNCEVENVCACVEIVENLKGIDYQSVALTHTPSLSLSGDGLV